MIKRNMVDTPEVSRFFDRTLRYYGISGKALSETTGVSQNHISEFRRGKSNPSIGIVWELILGADQLAPGSRRYFCQMLAGEDLQEKKPLSVGQQLERLIDSADGEEVELALLAIARKYRRTHNYPTSSDAALLKI